jgi:type IV pilus assembly protein PilM
MMVEVGANTTDISVVTKSVPFLTRSLDFGGLNVTKVLAKNLNIGLERAEQFKYDLGVSLENEAESEVPQSIIEAVSPILNEIKYMISLYESKHDSKIEKIVLSGGASLLNNFDKYLTKVLNLNVIIGDPWARISYPVDLKPVLKEIGPRFAAAIGLAMRGEN